MSLKGKTVLVTGAGRGIGKGIATEFAKLGCNLVIADINVDNAQTTAKELAGYDVETLALQSDISKW